MRLARKKKDKAGGAAAAAVEGNPSPPIPHEDGDGDETKSAGPSPSPPPAGETHSEKIARKAKAKLEARKQAEDVRRARAQSKADAKDMKERAKVAAKEAKAKAKEDAKEAKAAAKEARRAAAGSTGAGGGAGGGADGNTTPRSASRSVFKPFNTGKSKGKGTPAMLKRFMAQSDGKNNSAQIAMMQAIVESTAQASGERRGKSLRAKEVAAANRIKAHARALHSRSGDDGDSPSGSGGEGRRGSTKSGRRKKRDPWKDFGTVSIYNPLPDFHVADVETAHPKVFNTLLIGDMCAVLCFYISGCRANIKAVTEIGYMATQEPYSKKAHFFVCSLDSIETARDMQELHQWKGSFQHVYLPDDDRGVLKCFGVSFLPHIVLVKADKTLVAHARDCRIDKLGPILLQEFREQDKEEELINAVDPLAMETDA